jgi:hypothetical protein
VHIYRPRSARITAVAMVAVAGAVAGARIMGDGVHGAAPVIGLCALLAVAGVVAYWRPFVGVGPKTIEIRNVFHRVTIPLDRLVHVDTKWALELYLDDGSKVTAFVAPAPGAFAARTMRAEDARGLPRSTYVAGTVRPGDRLGTPSGDAASIVRRAWQKSRAEAAAGEGAPVVRGVDTGAVVALALGFAAAVAGFVV